MRTSYRPSPAAVLAFIALMVALGGTALAATGQIVNIADGSNAANVAKVDSTGKLNVGDGSGALTVNGNVTARETPTTTLVHVVGAGGGNANCVSVGAPPAGKAWILNSLTVNVVAPNGTPFAANQFVVVYPNSTCSYPYSETMTPTTVGPEHWEFPSGLVIPGGGAVSVALFNTNLTWELTAEGYSRGATAGPAPPTVPAPAGGGPPNSPDAGG